MMPTPTAAVAEHASQVIRQRIAQGAYPVGSLLPSQRELSEQLGVSRTSLREALSTLQGMGLVLARPGKGVYVTQPPASQAEALPWRFAKTCALADVYQLRFVLEGFAARLAAVAIQPTDIDWLRGNLAQMESALYADDLAQAGQLDFAFHLHIATLSGNGALADVLRASSEVMQESQRLPFYRRAARGTTGQEHAAIIEALAQGSPEMSQQAMTSHIIQAAQRAGVHFPVDV